MRNQIAAAQRMGVRAATINSDNTADWAAVEQRIERDEVDILLISPERFGNQAFIANVLAHIAPRIGLIVIDEAHCISDWGHDFRPHYRLISRILGNLPANIRILATTATANDRVVSDLLTVLGPDSRLTRERCGQQVDYLEWRSTAKSLSTSVRTQAVFFACGRMQVGALKFDTESRLPDNLLTNSSMPPLR